MFSITYETVRSNCWAKTMQHVCINLVLMKEEITSVRIDKSI